MKYYGKPKIEKIEHRLCEYIRCDNCNKKLKEKEKYFKVRHGNYDWWEYSDICEDCIIDFIKENLEKAKTIISTNIEIMGRIFRTDNNYEEYDKCEDELVENDEKED